MNQKKVILLPLDGSQHSLKALIPAKSLAKVLNLTIEILYVSDEELSKTELINKLNLCKEEISQCMINHKQGDVIEAILEESKKAAYIVMGTHVETDDLNKIAGSISSAIIRNSNIPILLIKPNSKIDLKDGYWSPQNALIPLNGTPGAAQILEHALKILNKTESKVEILHIPSSKSKAPDETGSLTTPYYTDSMQYEWQNWADEFLKRFCHSLKGNNLNYKLHLLSNDNPANEIISFTQSHNSDLIAMAWHGKLGHMQAETLKKVILEVECPILLMKIQ